MATPLRVGFFVTHSCPIYCIEGIENCCASSLCIVHDIWTWSTARSCRWRWLCCSTIHWLELLDRSPRIVMRIIVLIIPPECLLELSRIPLEPFEGPYGRFYSTTNVGQSFRSPLVPEILRVIEKIRIIANALLIRAQIVVLDFVAILIKMIANERNVEEIDPHQLMASKRKWCCCNDEHTPRSCTVYLSIQTTCFHVSTSISWSTSNVFMRNPWTRSVLYSPSCLSLIVSTSFQWSQKRNSKNQRDIRHRYSASYLSVCCRSHVPYFVHELKSRPAANW